MRRIVGLLMVAVALVIVPAPARAATPFTVGQGVNPKIAVAPNGTGYVVWGIPERGSGTDAAIGFCRIPAGGTACDRLFTIEYPGTATNDVLSPGNVTVTAESDTRIRVTGSCWQCLGAGVTEAVVRFVSSNGGSTAPMGEPGLGTTPTTNGVGPDGISVLDGTDNPFVTNAGGERIIARPVSGGTGDVDPVDGPFFVYTPSLVQVPGTQKLVYAVNDLGIVKYAVYTGTGFDATTIQDDTKWLRDRALAAPESQNQETKLNAGPSGVFLTYQRVVPGQDRVGLRRFDAAANAFGGPTYVDNANVVDASAGYPSSSQDAAGRVHVVWRSLYDTKRLRYTVSDPSGTSFAPARTLAQNEDFFLNPEVGAGAGGAGWAVWQSNGDTPIRVVPLDPYPDPGETPPPAPAPPPATPAPSTPTTPVPAGRRVRASVPGASITFGLPKACVQPGQTFRVTLSWKRQKRKGNKFVKVTRADFFIGSKVVKVDRKAPFTQTLRVTASARRGSTITVRARAFIKVKKGKAPKKSIRSTIKVCP